MPFSIIIDCLIVFASIVMLWKGADWLVDSAAEIAHTLKISDLIVGLTVVISKNRPSRSNIFLWVTIGRIIAVPPSMNPKLKIFEPITCLLYTSPSPRD